MWKKLKVLFSKAPFERFTQSSRRVIFFGACFARQEGASRILCNHLLRGFDMENSHLLEAIGADRSQLHEIWQRQQAVPNAESSDYPPLQEKAYRAIKSAVNRAESDASFCVEPVHLLAAIYETDEDIRGWLRQIGVTQERIQETLKDPPRQRMTKSRSGIAYDLHRLEPGRKLILGGIEVPFEKGPMGHSDGDVLAHAICDALLGAAGLGDIGTHFPDTDPQWKGAPSLRFLEHARKLLDQRGLRITHIDAVVVTEKPKLVPHFPAMRESLAKALGVRADQINLKAKTNEGVDAVGRGEAIAAHAIATLETGK